jgi:hypothetical protein
MESIGAALDSSTSKLLFFGPRVKGVEEWEPVVLDVLVVTVEVPTEVETEVAVEVETEVAVEVVTEVTVVVFFWVLV